MAASIRYRFGWDAFYLADLDAILGDEPAWSLYRSLHEMGLRLWVDAGVCGVTRACQLGEMGIDTIVIGLETIAGPSALAEIIQLLGERIVFSLDLCAGEPLGNRKAWDRADAVALAAQAVRLGIRRMLVLDLADVGTNQGTKTLEFLSQLRSDHPHLELSAGGGIRNRNDLLALRAVGVRVALVSSALHEGRLTPEDCAGL